MDLEKKVVLLKTNRPFQRKSVLKEDPLGARK